MIIINIQHIKITSFFGEVIGNDFSALQPSSFLLGSLFLYSSSKGLAISFLGNLNLSPAVYLFYSNLKQMKFTGANIIVFSCVPTFVTGRGVSLIKGNSGP